LLSSQAYEPPKLKLAITMSVQIILQLASGFPTILGLHHVDHIRKPKAVNFHRPKAIMKDGSGNDVGLRELAAGQHHYVIATRPRCMFASFEWNEQSLTGWGNIEFELGYKKYRLVPFELNLGAGKKSPFKLNLADLNLDPTKPFDVRISDQPDGYPNKLAFSQRKKNEISILHLEPDLLHFLEFDQAGAEDLLDFRIEYIGISTGADGQRNFVDRLWAHEKVREISAQIQKNAPNLQVYVFGYEVGYALEVGPDSFLADYSQLEAVLNPREQAEIFEAMLISHFQPRHNTEFKNFLVSEFPNWLAPLREAMHSSWGRDQEELFLLAMLASDNTSNPFGKWTFGGFYTDETRNRSEAGRFFQITRRL
jgi:hypothetical protein